MLLNQAKTKQHILKPLEIVSYVQIEIHKEEEQPNSVKIVTIILSK